MLNKIFKYLKKIKYYFNKIKSNKRAMYILVVSVLTLFCLVLNTAFGLFTASVRKDAANLTVNGLNYSTTLNKVSGNIITAPANDITKVNVGILANNKYTTNYELVYEICTDSACNNKIQSVNGLDVEYSSLTIDEVSGQITTTGKKNIRIVIINNTNTQYYIKIGVNSGFGYNTLPLKDLIITEYEENDLTLITYVNGTRQDSFPNNKGYRVTIDCVAQGNNSITTTGTANWDSSLNKWNITINNLEKMMTTCTVNFNNNVEIRKIEDLVRLSNEVAAGNNYEGVTFTMQNDLDFNNTSDYENANRTDFGDVNKNGTVETIKTELTKTNTKGFNPIGRSSGTPFSGTFDGNNKTLSNLYIHNTDTNDTAARGLFGYISGATIKDFSLTGTVYSINLAAGLVGRSGQLSTTSTISNCTNRVNVQNNTNANSSGGIVAQTVNGSTLTIQNSKNYGTIQDGETTGGIIGLNEGTTQITGSNNYGAINNSQGKNIAGILGKTTAGSVTIQNSGNEGQITTASQSLNIRMGGGVGYAAAPIHLTNVTNSATLSENEMGANAGGIVGRIDSSGDSTITSCTNTGNIEAETSGGVLGFYYSSGTVTITGANNDATVTSSEIAGGIVGSQGTGTIVIDSSYNKKAITNGAEAAGGIVGKTNATLTVKATHNQAGVTNSDGIYVGGILGYGDSNSNISIINNTDNSGVISYTGSESGRVGGIIGYANGTINLKNCNNTANLGSAFAVGGIIAGMNGTGTIDNCTNNGTVTSTGSYTGGLIGYLGESSSGNFTLKNSSNLKAVSNGTFVGGLIGQNNSPNTVTLQDNSNTASVSNTVGKNTGGLIGHCYNTAGTTIIQTCNNSGSVSNGLDSANNIGGLIGTSDTKLTIESSYNTGAIKSSRASFTSNPAITIGGLIGFNKNKTTIYNSRNSGAISVGKYIGGIIGYSSDDNSVIVIDRSYNNQTVTASTDMGGQNAGGIIGYTNNTTFTILNSYNNKKITSSNGPAGGLVGYSSNNTTAYILNSYNNGAVSAGTYAGGISNSGGTSSTITIKLFNVYSTSGITGSTTSYVIGRYIGAPSTAVGVYYPTGTTASNQSIGTGVSSTNYSASSTTTTSLTYLLNNNIKNKIPSAYNSALSSYDHNTYSGWKNSTSGSNTYPNFNYSS